MTALAGATGAAPVDAGQVAAVIGVTRRTVERRAAAESWPYTTTAQRGGHKRGYALASLPQDVRNAFAVAELKALARQRLGQATHAPQAVATVPAAAATPATTAPATPPAPTPAAALMLYGQARRVAGPGELTDKDRTVVDATLVLCQAVDEAIAETGTSARRACAELAQRICDGRAFDQLVYAARATYLRPRTLVDDPQRVGGQGPLCQRLQRLYSFYRKGLAEGDPARYLVPAKVAQPGELIAHAHRAAFLLHYCRPARPMVSQAWRDSAAWYDAQGLRQPGYDTFVRLENALPMLVKNRGRMTGSAWRSLKPYTERDVSMFHANDLWVGDGHTFKATVQSPIHGRAFRPEVTFVLDWVSRKIVGYSVDLAESTIAVSAAFRDAQLRTKARPLVYYSDNGSGQTGKFIDCDVHGTLARQGIAHETGIPGNPQGRGVIERVWAGTLIAQAATYPTFMGKRADAETVRVTAVQVGKDQRAGRISALVPRWDTFLADLEATVEAYNARSHSSLGKQTPDQVYLARLDPDSVVFTVDDAEIHTLWMPEARRMPQRGLIELFNNTYFMPGLVDLLGEGEEVRVRFDIHRAERVWVLDSAGRLLGEAEWNGHRRAAFPVAYIDAKRAERVERKVAKKLGEADAARDELMQTVDALDSTDGAGVIDLPAMPEPKPQPLRTAPGPAAAPVRDAAPISFLESNVKLAALGAAKRAADEAAGIEKKVAGG